MDKKIILTIRQVIHSVITQGVSSETAAIRRLDMEGTAKQQHLVRIGQEVHAKVIKRLLGLKTKVFPFRLPMISQCRGCNRSCKIECHHKL